MAQVWPRQDTFDAGGTHYGSRLTQWLGCRPSANSSWSYGILGDFDGDGHPYPHGLGGGTDKPCGFLWRPYIQEDQEVEVQAYLREDAPANIPSSPFLTGIGVLARVTGGVLSIDATPQIHYADVSGYAFLLQAEPVSATATFLLIRYNSGTPTVLGSFPYSLGAIPTDFETPVGLRLRVTTSGGNVALAATISNVTYLGSVVSNLTLFSVVDSSASKITGSGRAGMLLGQDRVVTLAPGFDVKLREKVTSWTVRDPSDSSVIVRDEFKRTNLSAAYQATSDFGDSGRSVQTGFVHDINSSIVTAGKILRDTSPSDAVFFEAAGLGDPNRVIWACLSQRPADDTRNQNPKITGRFKSSGTNGAVNIRQLGVIARGSYTSPAATAATLSGYVLFIDVRGSTWTVSLVRYVAGSPTVIASATLAGKTEDTDYTLELAVRDQPGTGLGGPVEMEAELDGSPIVLVAETSIPGVFNSSSGVVVDGTAERITEGPGEGIWASSNDTTKVVGVTTWDQGTIVPSVTPWEDLMSYSVADEGAASDNLANYCRVVYPFAPSLTFNTETQVSDAAYRYTQARLSRGFQTYESVATEPLTETQYLALLAFWHSKEGGLPFTWSDPTDGIPRKMRFTPGSWRPTEPFRGVHIVYFGMEELAS